MSGKLRGGAVGFVAIALLAGLSSGSAVAQSTAKLRYGFQKGRQYAYDVKIVAQLPDEELTHEGTLNYTVLSATDEQFALKCAGVLAKSAKPNPGAAPQGIGGPPRGFGGPRIPGPPRFGGPPGFGAMSEPVRPEGTTFNRQGGIVIFGQNASLPCLLGDEVELIVESFPDDAKANWDRQLDLGVTERSEASGPFFHPIGPRAASETNRGAKELVNYAVLETRTDSVRISKIYSLKTAPEADGVIHIDMAGNGEFAFDPKAGIVKTLSMKYDIHVNEKNVAVTIPVTLKYQLLSDAEIAERKKKAEAAAAAFAEANKPKPLAPGEREKLLQDLRSGDENRISTAAKRLGKAVPDDKPVDICRALCKPFKLTNEWIQADILAALEIWNAPEAEKTLIEGSQSKSFFVRAKAITLLGKHKTTAAAEAAAAQMQNNRGEVGAALKAIGPIAESATMPLLKDRDFWVRNEACGVLAEIGGKKSLRAMKEEAAKLDAHNRRAFDTAIATVERRLASAADDSEAEEPAEAANQTDAGPKMRSWQDATGTYKVEATFVKAEGKAVTIKKDNGKTISMTLDKLSKADQEYVKQQVEAQEKKPANPFE